MGPGRGGRKEYSLAPCHHLFVSDLCCITLAPLTALQHTHCLEQWLAIKVRTRGEELDAKLSHHRVFAPSVDAPYRPWARLTSLGISELGQLGGETDHGCRRYLEYKYILFRGDEHRLQG